MKFIFTSGKDTKVYYCWSIIVIVRVGNNIRQNFPFAMHVGIQPSGGKTPLILKFDTSLEWMINLTSRPLFPLGLHLSQKAQILWHFRGFELRSLVSLALKLVAVSTEVACLPNSWENNILRLLLFVFALFWYFNKLPSSILLFLYSFLFCPIVSVINQVTCSHGTCLWLTVDINFSSEISSIMYGTEIHWKVEH